MIADVLRYLRCPHCHADLALAGGTARCPAGHAFDLARQGYLTLLAARALVGNADTAEMVNARRSFLAAGHLRFLAEELAARARSALGIPTLGIPAPGIPETAAPDPRTSNLRTPDPQITGTPAQETAVSSVAAQVTPASRTAAHETVAQETAPHETAPQETAAADLASPPGCVLDVGGGTGYHLSAVLDALPGRPGIVLDLSRHAARHAVRAHPRAEAVVADAWQPLPVRTAVAALALNVFAPRNGAELHRVLRPDGALVVATPTPDHLAELVGPLDLLTVDPRKPERVAGQLDRYFSRQAGQRLDRVLLLSRPAVAAMVGMGPNARHLDPERLAVAVDRLPEPCPVTVSFQVATYRPRP